MTGGLKCAAQVVGRKVDGREAYGTCHDGRCARLSQAFLFVLLGGRVIDLPHVRGPSRQPPRTRVQPGAEHHQLGVLWLRTVSSIAT